MHNSLQLEFDRGSSSNPSGHALVYFRDSTERDAIAVTYIVILPIPLDIAKYMPPFLAGQVAELSADEISSFAFPPAPERLANWEEASRIADVRGDDLVFGGTVSLSDAFDMMDRVNEVSVEYGRLYTQAHGEPDAIGRDDEDLGIDGDLDESVYDLMYGGMDEADLLAELTQLLGRMQYSANFGDDTEVSDSKAKLNAIGRYLPANREVGKIIAAASSQTPRASELAQLYVERAYCLYREDYLRLKKIDADIAGIHAEE